MASTGTTTIETLTDAARFLDRAQPLVVRDPVRHSVIWSNAVRCRRDPVSSPEARWYLLHRGGRPVALAMQTPPHPPHLAFEDAGLAEDLAAELTRQGRDVDGVGGPRASAEAFASRWVADHGGEDAVRTHVRMEQGVYDLPVDPSTPWQVEGRVRAAGTEDLALVRTWISDFHDEAMRGEGRGAPDPEPHVIDGRVALWEVGGRPVSMCYSSVPGAGVTRISGVWTPTADRGHGYASAVVAAWSRRQMDQGLRCMLYTDLANPTSNGIYQQLGYRRIGDNLLLDLLPCQA